MRYVIDSSVAFKWLISEQHSDKALELRDEWIATTIDFIAPDFFPVELAHSLTRAERSGRILQSESLRLLASLMQTLPGLESSLFLLPRGCEISSRYRIGVYDCLYVALAERENCEFITADTRLVNVLQDDFPFVIELASR